MSLLAAAARSFLWQWEPSRYQRLFLRMGLTESQVQVRAVEILTLRYKARVAVIDTGAKRLRGRAVSIINATGGDPRRLIGRATGMEAGISDLAFTLPGGRAGWIEMKKPGFYAPSPKTGQLIQRKPPGVPTKEQLDFLDEQAALGAVAGVAWSGVDVDTIMAAAGVRPC